METQRLVNTQQDEVKTEYNIYRHYDTGNVIYSSLFGFVFFFWSIWSIVARNLKLV